MPVYRNTWCIVCRLCVLHSFQCRWLVPEAFGGWGAGLGGSFKFPGTFMSPHGTHKPELSAANLRLSRTLKSSWDRRAWEASEELPWSCSHCSLPFRDAVLRLLLLSISQWWQGTRSPSPLWGWAAGVKTARVHPGIVCSAIGVLSSSLMSSGLFCFRVTLCKRHRLLAPVASLTFPVCVSSKLSESRKGLLPCSWLNLPALPLAWQWLACNACVKMSMIYTLILLVTPSWVGFIVRCTVYLGLSISVRNSLPGNWEL